MAAPFIPPDQEEIDREALRDREILDQRPFLQRVAPPGQGLPPGVTAATVPLPGATLGAAAEHALTLVAAYHDHQQLGMWLDQSLQTLRDVLASTVAPLSARGLQDHQYELLRAAYPGGVIAFGDYVQALDHPENPLSGLVLTAWERFHFGWDGRLDALLYADLYRLQKSYHPVISRALADLTTLSAFTLLGVQAPSSDVVALLEQLSQAAAQPDGLTTPDQQIAPYQQMAQTLSATTSSIWYVGQDISQLLDDQLALPENAVTLVTQIGQVSDTGNGIGAKLSTLIAAFEGLRTLFELYNEASWLSYSALRARLDALIESLLYEVLAEVATIFSHVQSQLLSPVLTILSVLDTALGYNHSLAAVDAMAQSLYTLYAGTVGKYQQFLLDMYRNSSLHNSLTQDRVGQAGTNTKLKNMLKILDHLIAFLELIEEGEQEFEGVAAQVGQYFQSSTTGLATLAPMPTLSLQRPAPDASLGEIATSTASGGFDGQGTSLASQVSDLLDLIRGNGSPA